MLALLSSNISVSPVHSVPVSIVSIVPVYPLVATAHCDSDLVSSARPVPVAAPSPPRVHLASQHLGMVMCNVFGIHSGFQ